MMAKRVFIVTDRIGRGDDELGRVLMKSFLYSLARNAEKPRAVMLMNEGVRLACTGSDSLDDLALLAENGVAIRACGTCLDYLGLKDALVVGEVGTMPDSVAALIADPDVLTIG
jgi:selenium metabolism protein YedF